VILHSRSDASWSGVEPPPGTVWVSTGDCVALTSHEIQAADLEHVVRSITTRENRDSQCPISVGESARSAQISCWEEEVIECAPPVHSPGLWVWPII
jgi:hypothetical protein